MTPIFSWLRSPFSSSSLKESPSVHRIPEGEIVYAVGDIHGELRLLNRLIDVIQEDFSRQARSLRATVVFLGDYIDRGEDCRGVIDRLLAEPLAGFQHRFLAGNHEQVLLQFLQDPAGGAGWLEFGGLETLLSYGVSVSAGQRGPGRLRAARDAFQDRLPEAHVSFLTGLETMVVIGGYAFVHAGVRPGRPLDRQKVEDLLWIRSPFLESTLDHGKRIVHGHTIVDQVMIRDNRIAVDTGAYASGCLSAVACQGEDVRILTATHR